MQLPKNTVPSEPNFLAPFIVGATSPVGKAEDSSGVGAAPSDSDFGELFDELAPPSKPAKAASASTVANAELMFCPPPFLPLPPVEEALLANETDDETLVEDASTSSDCAFPTPEAGNVPAAVGSRKPDANVSMGAGLGERDVRQPNAHAAERAFQTPRFVGLPGPALENRSAPAFPPGLTPSNLDEGEVVSPESNDISAGGTAEIPLRTSWPAAAFAGRPTIWPGASTRTQLNPLPAAQPGGGVSPNVASGLPDGGSADVAEVFEEVLGGEVTEAAGKAVELGASMDLGTATNIEASADLNREVSSKLNSSDLLSHDGANRRKSAGATLNSRESVSSTANIAAAQNDRTDSIGDAADKPFIQSDKERVTVGRKRVGTDVAKGDAAMFSRYLSSPNQQTASEHAAFGAAVLDQARDVGATAESAVAESVSTAHEAVEVVLKAVDHASTQEQKSVNLRFSVGEADLSVRVELHQNQVRTTFRTDSPELRAALTQEWESLANSNPGERTLKLVPAFGTASEHSALNSSAGDTSSRQRERNAERESRDGSVRAVSTSRGMNAASAVSAPVTSSVTPLTSHRLHTVA